MSPLKRVFCTIAVCTTVATAMAADATKASPFGQAGNTATATTGLDNIDFAGVSTVGKRTMINLYDKQQKRSFWVEAGKPGGDFTVTNYDSAHDQITIKSKGAEKVLPLRPPSAVVNGTAAAPVVATPALSAGTTAGTTTTATPSLSQARQEEEARMLVSDLLEIGMAQRKAYEEAQRRAAAGLPPHPTAAETAAGNAAQPQAAPPQPNQPAATATPSQP